MKRLHGNYLKLYKEKEKTRTTQNRTLNWQKVERHWIDSLDVYRQRKEKREGGG